MVSVDMKIKIMKSENFGLTPELINRILKSRLLVFHFLTFLWHMLLNYQTILGAVYLLFYQKDIVNKTCGFGIQYATIWNFVIEQNYFNACLIQDVLELIPDTKYDKLKSYLTKALPFVFTSVVFPFSILVTLNFWGIYTHHPHVIDEDNVTQLFFPSWVNHGLHTTNLVLVFAEVFAAHRPYSTKLRSFLWFFSVVTAYCVTCTILYYVGGVWPYPLVNMMSVWQRYLYIGVNYLLGYFLLEIQRALNDKIWGEEITRDVKKST